MCSHPLIVEDQPSSHDLEYLEDQINHYNMVQTGAFDDRELAIFVRDEQQAIVAGLSGFTWAGICEVQFLWVHPSMQHQSYGSQLLQAVEREAQKRGCSIITLSTYSFQAPGFYQKHGYEMVGSIEHCPPNHTDYYFKKRLPVTEEAPNQSDTSA